MNLIKTQETERLFHLRMLTDNAWAFSGRPAAGKIFPNFKSLGLIPPIAGGRQNRQGYNTSGDIPVQTTDGINLNDLWADFTRAITLKNQNRQTLINLLTFPVTQLIEVVPQFGQSDFERASEFGEPVGQRAQSGYFTLGYTFDDYDLATRYTWRFLRDATAQQLEALHQQALDADSRLIYHEVLSAIFDNRNRTASINGQGVNVYALYNGDGTVPPPYEGNTFDGSHTHYRTSGYAVVNSAVLDSMISDMGQHGYSQENGVSLLLIVNEAEANVIRRFRMNISNGTDGDDNPITPTYDFVPAQGQPAQWVDANSILVGGGQAPSNVRGLTVIGSYGSLVIAQRNDIPAGYMLLVGTGGPDSLTNPVGFREHANPAYRGMQLIPGPSNAYPLTDSYYTRGFGTGIRQRGGSMVMQIAGTDPDNPPAYTRPAAFSRG